MKEYEQVKNQLIKEINQKQQVLEKLSNIEQNIYRKELDYFNESPYGNVIKGFDNFNKVGNTKKKVVYTEDDHIFSLSSIKDEDEEEYEDRTTNE